MSDEQNIHIEGRVTYDKSVGPIENATVRLYAGQVRPEAANLPSPIAHARTNANGYFEIEISVEPGDYAVLCEAFGVTEDQQLAVVAGRQDYEAPLDLELGLILTWHRSSGPDGKTIQVPYAIVGRPVVARTESKVENDILHYHWHIDPAVPIIGDGDSKEAVCVFERPGLSAITATITDRGGDGGAKARVFGRLPVVEETRTVDVRGELGVHGDIGVRGHVRVKMERTDSRPTPDEWLWRAIDERCEAIGFERYQAHIRRVFELPNLGPFPGEFSRKLGELGARGVGVYRVLRDLTELFVLLGCGPIVDRESSRDDSSLRDFGPQLQRSREEIEEGLRQYLHNGELPYIERVVNAAYSWLDLDGSGLDALRRRALRQPLFLELWHEMCLEHGMLMRTMDAVCARFQNIYNSGENDGLASYEISPLWPLGDFSVGLDQQRTVETEPEASDSGIPASIWTDRARPRRVMASEAADVRTAFPDAFTNLHEPLRGILQGRQPDNGHCRRLPGARGPESRCIRSSRWARATQRRS